VPGLHARDSRREYEELLGSAERSVWVPTSFLDWTNRFGTIVASMTRLAKLVLDGVLGLEP
jgi:hypothetical protein